MALTKIRYGFFCRALSGVLFLLISSALCAQASSGAVSLSAEIAAVEKKLADPKLGSTERKSALENLARLHELSGDVERAAELWWAAAHVVPASGHEALLRSARCLAAVGEFDRAAALLEPVLAVSGNKALRIKAMTLRAQLEALASGDTSGLGSLALNPDFADEKPALYYSIWRISSDPAIKAAAASRLASECPQSPEARLVRDDSLVSAAPSALWLFLGVREAPGVAAASPELPPAAAPAVVPAAIPGSSPRELTESEGSGNSPVILQTGLFSLEENAHNLARRLRSAGFSPVVAKKTISGKEHWTVGVPPGDNPSLTALLLKDKGFESFPVY